MFDDAGLQGVTILSKVVLYNIAHVLISNVSKRNFTGCWKPVMDVTFHGSYFEPTSDTKFKNTALLIITFLIEQYFV